LVYTSNLIKVKTITAVNNNNGIERAGRAYSDGVATGNSLKKVKHSCT
jgi:hypothetical protein